jgi:uncharacterized protein YdbL (DUF1318 family)
MRVALLALVAAGCLAVTVNVTFPQEKLDSAASNIEDLVGGGSGTPSKSSEPELAPGTGGDKPQGWTAPPTGWLAWLGPAAVEAQAVPELKTRTPEVMAAIESRRKRAADVDRALAKGCVGETNQGLLESREGGQGCPDNVRAVVSAENADRMFLYKTLVEQNSMPPGDISRVQAAFARARREKAPAGAWVQTESGEWRKR